MKIKKYNQFINESVNVTSCMYKILEFLKDNNINTWDDFENTTPFKRDCINKLISSEITTPKELNEIRFQIRLNLCNKSQLKDMIKQYETNEEYEKCRLLLNKIESL